MRHFVGYHNVDKMGYSAAESDPLALYTSKNPKDLPGNVIWVIAGEGKNPRRYFLNSWFIVSEIGKADHPDFGRSISGNVGGVLAPRPNLNERDWFPDFLKSNANFSLGLREVKDEEVIDSLKSLATEANCPVP